MLKNYIKIAIRNLRKKSGFALINLFGLATGITCSLLLLLYVQDEISYDNFHQDGDNIYRIAGSYDQGGDERNESAQTTFLLAPALESISGIENWVRIQMNSGLMTYEDKKFQEDNVLFADSSFFQFFTFPLESGNRQTALKHVNSIVISQSMAKKYFEKKEAIDETMVIDGIALKVTGIMADFPTNSHFNADFVVSMTTALPLYPDWILTNPSGLSHYTYVKLSDNSKPNDVIENLDPFIKQSFNEENEASYFLQPLNDIHLQSHLNSELATNGDLVYTYIFLSIALLIILIACINYMNMAIAKSATRAKEVGLRKIVGASRYQLVFQHLTESIILALIAVLIGGLATELLLPYFNELAGKSIEQNLITDFRFLAILIGIGILVGILAGFYPAFYLSHFKAIKILKNKSINLGGSTVSFRKILIIFQLTATSVLIIGTIFIQKQLNFLHQDKLGINSKGVVYFTLPTAEIRDKYESIKTDLLNVSTFEKVSATNNNPISRVGNWREYIVGEERIMVPTIIVETDYFETLEAEMVDGRTFSKDFITDQTQSYVMNESAQQLLKLDQGVGAALTGMAFTGSEWTEKKATVIGVAKDFHFTSLHSKIQPVIFSLNSEITTPMNFVMARYNDSNPQEAVNQLTKVWDKYANGRPIELSFMDEAIQNLYNAEQRFLSVFYVFSIIAIIIACLGALGLVSYTVSQLTKQIGVRKVLGASTWSLVKLVNSGFYRMLLVSFVISVPISYYFVNNWLETFAYKVNLSWLPFLQAAVLLFTIGALTTSFQSIKAALTNPSDTLKEE